MTIARINSGGFMKAVAKGAISAIALADAEHMAGICYRSRRADDGDVREKLRVLTQERRQFGYRRLHILLRRDGVLINRKRPRGSAGGRLDGAAAQGP